MNPTGADLQTVDPNDIERFNDSLERCFERPGFLTRFYTHFVASSDAVAKKFEHTNLHQQAKTLKISLYIMAMAGTRPERALHLEELARRHGRTALDIGPELYDLWLEQLLRTVEEFDPRFDPEIEKVWRRVLQPGIDFMKSRY